MSRNRLVWFALLAAATIEIAGALAFFDARMVRRP